MDVFSIFAHLRGEDGQWSGWERDELLRLRAASAADLDNQIWEDGVTDSGDPWIVAVDEDSLELSLHVARLSGAYVAVSGDLLPVSSGANLRTVVNDCLVHIRANRHEIAPADGATLRMPIGVSAAAFGIFLTERLAVFEGPMDRAQTSLEVSKLGPNPSESFVFLSSLATSPVQLQADDPVAVSFEGEDVQGEDRIILPGFVDESAEQIIISARPAPDREDDEAQEIDVAEVVVTAPALAGPIVSDEATISQTDVAPSNAEGVSVEPAQTADGGGVDVVVAPAQITVSEDKTGDEEVSDQSEDDDEVVVASAGVAAESAASSMATSPPSGDCVELPDDTALLEFPVLDHPSALSEGDEAETSGDWIEVHTQNDLFAV